MANYECRLGHSNALIQFRALFNALLKLTRCWTMLKTPREECNVSMPNRFDCQLGRQKISCSKHLQRSRFPFVSRPTCRYACQSCQNGELGKIQISACRGKTMHVEFKFLSFTYVVRMSDGCVETRDKDHIGGPWTNVQDLLKNKSVRLDFRKALAKAERELLKWSIK